MTQNLPVHPPLNLGRRYRHGWIAMLIVGAAAVSACGLRGSDGPPAEVDGAGNPSVTGEIADSSDPDDATVETGGMVDEEVVVEVSAAFEPGSCPADLPADYRPSCGTVEVPMDWATGEGSVTLTVAVFASTVESPARDPVVYLEGGPGGHALATVAFSTEELLDPLLTRGDVVVFDQRGAGLSEPRLNCPEVTAAVRELEDIPIVEDAESERRYLQALSDCGNRLTKAGIDLSDFNSMNNAHDIEAIRIALGYDRWNLFGVSYGTRLALEVMRRHPDGLRAVVLDSVFPPEVDSAADNPHTFIDSYMKVTRACRAEAACATGGDLAERFEDLVQRVQVSPESVTVVDFVTGATDEIYLTGDALIGIVTQALYSPTWFTDLPELASDLESGQTRVAAQFLSQQRTLERYFTDGMFYAVTCHEEIALTDPADVVDPPDPFGLRRQFDLASNTGSNAFETCAVFDSGRAAPSAGRRVESDVPTLLMAGEFDPVTPVAWAESAAAGLSRATLVVGPNASHGVFSTDCGMSVILAFLDDPTGQPDATCLAEGDLRFVGPGIEEIELVEAAYPADPWPFQINTVRPADWSVGSLGGDQYRQQSFLDPTQLFQLAGTASLGDGLIDFIDQQWAVAVSEPTPFSGPAALGSLSPQDLTGDWRRGTGIGAGVVVEWFESDIAGEDGVKLFVILVSTPEERSFLVDQVLIPALQAVTIER